MNLLRVMAFLFTGFAVLVAVASAHI